MQRYCSSLQYSLAPSQRRLLALVQQASMKTLPFPAQTHNNFETLQVTLHERSRDLDQLYVLWFSALTAQHCLFETWGPNKFQHFLFLWLFQFPTIKQKNRKLISVKGGAIKDTFCCYLWSKLQMQGLLSRNPGISLSSIFMEVTTDLNDWCILKIVDFIISFNVTFLPKKQVWITFWRHCLIQLRLPHWCEFWSTSLPLVGNHLQHPLHIAQFIWEQSHLYCIQGCCAVGITA